MEVPSSGKTMTPGDWAAWVGVAVALLVGGGGLWVGLVANSRANEAKALSEESNQIARGANSLAELNSSRATERNDVKWTHRLDSEVVGRFILKNEGVDPAHDVVAIVTLDGRQQVVQMGLVEGSGLIEALFPEVAERIVSTARQWEELLRQNILMGTGTHHCTVSARVLWKTPLSTPRQQDIPQYRTNAQGRSE